MKATITLLWTMLGLVSQTAFAQMQQPAQFMFDLLAQSDLAVPPYNSSGNFSSDASGLQSEAGVELSAPPLPAVRLKPQIQGDVTYLCGGIGAEEASYMKSEARGYDLMLTFAAQDGSYLADVNVDIRDAQGEPVLQTKCDSPLLLVELPRSGMYRIHAETAGYALNQTVKVTAKEQRGARIAAVVLTWPQQVAEAPATPGSVTSGGGVESTGGSGAGQNSR